MKILIGKTFGIGNACLAIPMIKAISSLGQQIDVLLCSSVDDFGSYEIFQEFHRNNTSVIDKIHIGNSPFLGDFYDLAIMAIPYDGRWKNGIHFFAKEVMDERKRPGNVERLGFDMWKKHEIEYMMENARELGFQGDTPDCSFFEPSQRDTNLVYLGIGYKRDLGGFGKSKHFGSARFADLMKSISLIRPETRFVSSGPIPDVTESHIIETNLFKKTSVSYTHFPLASDGYGLRKSLSLIGGAGSYIGNDTGMMHVAASLGLPTFGLFAYPDLIVKNPPFCTQSRALHFTADSPSIEIIAKQFVDLVWGRI